MDILTERIGDMEKNIGTGGSSTLASESVYYKKIGEDTIPIPKGFYYVGGTKESGVVISDNKEDEDVYANTENGDVPSGADEDAYDDSGKIIEEKLKIKGNQFVWIPCNVKDYKKINFSMTNASSWEKWTYSAELQQIEKYGGFYVGRFEAGTSNVTFINDTTKWDISSNASNWQNANFTSDKVTGTITEKPGEIPYYHADYGTANDMCSGMYMNNASVYSGLITGTMWDAIMQFITTDAGETKTYTDLKNTSWGNYNNKIENILHGRYLDANKDFISTATLASIKNGKTKNGILTTASTDNFRNHNLYDLAGNLWEWTQEACWLLNDQERYILRGGGFYSNFEIEPVCYRGWNIVSATYTYSRISTSTFYKVILKKIDNKI